MTDFSVPSLWSVLLIIFSIFSWRKASHSARNVSPPQRQPPLVTSSSSSSSAAAAATAALSSFSSSCYNPMDPHACASSLPATSSSCSSSCQPTDIHCAPFVAAALHSTASRPPRTLSALDKYPTRHNPTSFPPAMTSSSLSSAGNSTSARASTRAATFHHNPVSVADVQQVNKSKDANPTLNNNSQPPTASSASSSSAFPSRLAWGQRVGGGSGPDSLYGKGGGTNINNNNSDDDEYDDDDERELYAVEQRRRQARRQRQAIDEQVLETNTCYGNATHDLARGTVDRRGEEESEEYDRGAMAAAAVAGAIAAAATHRSSSSSSSLPSASASHTTLQETLAHKLATTREGREGNYPPASALQYSARAGGRMSGRK